MSTVIDYAWAQITAAQIKAWGHDGVMRYVSHDNSKDLSVRERDNLLALNLTIGLIYESVANRAAQGFAAGQKDAQDANQKASSLGYPLDCTLWYAVDFDASTTTVTPYFEGVAAAGGRPYAPYGSYKICEGVVCNGVPWQTRAWSGGKVSGRAGLLQNVFHNDYDVNKILKTNYGQWGQQPQPAPPETKMYYFWKYKSYRAVWNVLGGAKVWMDSESTMHDISGGAYKVIEVDDGAAILWHPAIQGTELPPSTDWPYTPA